MTDTDNSYFPPIELEQLQDDLFTTVSMVKNLEQITHNQVLSNQESTIMVIEKFVRKLPLIRTASTMVLAANHLIDIINAGKLTVVNPLATPVERRIMFATPATVAHSRELWSFVLSVERLALIFSQWELIAKQLTSSTNTDTPEHLAEKAISMLETWGIPGTVVRDTLSVSHGDMGLQIQGTEISTEESLLSEQGYTYDILVSLSTRLETGYNSLLRTLTGFTRALVRDIHISSGVQSAFLCELGSLAVATLKRTHEVREELLLGFAATGDISTESSEDKSSGQDELCMVCDQAQEQIMRLRETIRDVEGDQTFVSVKQQHRLLNIVKVATTGLKQIEKRYLGGESKPDAPGKIRTFGAALVDGMKERLDITRDPGMTCRNGGIESKAEVTTRLTHNLEQYVHTLKSVSKASGAADKATLSAVGHVVREVNGIIHETQETAIDKLNVKKD